MKIDWKYVANTKGYKSLKAAYIQDVQKAREHERKFGRAMRDKAEFLKLFNWVIARATHYAHHENSTIDVVLDRWESKRTCWWLGFYGESKYQPKYTSGSLCPKGINGIRQYYKNDGFRRCPINRKARVFSYIMLEQKNSSTKSPKRWTAKRKADYKKYGR